MNGTIRLGQVVVSTQGHDKNQNYIVVGINDKRVLLCDGEFKFLKKPKQKNILHIKPIDFVDSEISTKLKDGHKVNDQMIYHALLKFKKSNKE